MTTHTEKTAPTAPTVDADNENIAERSVITAYMPDPRNHTGVDYATISGITLPRSKYMEVLIPIADVVRIIRGHNKTLAMNQDCLKANNRLIQERKEEERIKAEENLRRILSQELEEIDYAEELKDLEDKIEAIYRRIDKEVDRKISTGGKIS